MKKIIISIISMSVLMFAESNGMQMRQKGLQNSGCVIFQPHKPNKEKSTNKILMSNKAKNNEVSNKAKNNEGSSSFAVFINKLNAQTIIMKNEK